MALLGEIRGFKKTNLRPVATRVTRPDGRKMVEKSTPLGFATTDFLSGPTAQGWAAEADLDLDMPEVIPNLIIAGQDVAENLALMQNKGITHVLNVATNIPNHFPKKFCYRRMNIMDLPDTNILKYFNDMFKFIDQGRQSGKVLVHGNVGRSRAPTIVVGYLMLRENLRFLDALQRVREQKPSAQPNSGFMRQLEQYDHQLYGAENGQQAGAGAGGGQNVPASDF